MFKSKLFVNSTYHQPVDYTVPVHRFDRPMPVVVAAPVPPPQPVAHVAIHAQGYTKGVRRSILHRQGYIRHETGVNAGMVEKVLPDGSVYRTHLVVDSDRSFNDMRFPNNRKRGLWKATKHRVDKALLAEQYMAWSQAQLEEYLEEQEAYRRFWMTVPVFA